jgi:hypothetical protein
MDRLDYATVSINGVRQRIKDLAGKGFALLREGSEGEFIAEVDAEVFDEVEPDERKRDAQIEALKTWYAESKDRLRWDKKRLRLVPMNGENKQSPL